MRILAIDPGTTESGIVLYDNSWIGAEIGFALVCPNDEVLHLIQSDRYAEQLAIEMVASFGMPVGEEVFQTVLWTGRFQQRWMDTHAGKPVRLVKRMEVKMHLCHSPKAKDGNVRQALVDKLGAPGSKSKPGPTYGVKSHCWSALAVAVVADETVQA